MLWWSKAFLLSRFEVLTVYRAISYQALLIALALTSGAAQAREIAPPVKESMPSIEVTNSSDPKVNLVNLSVKVEQAIDNDTMSVRLFNVAEAATAGEAYALNTKALDKVFSRIEKLDSIKASASNRRSTPVYSEVTAEALFATSLKSDSRKAAEEARRPKIVGWRERAEVTLTSQDFQALSAVMSDLSGDLQIESMGFKVSDKALEAQESEMLSRAMAEFRSKAQSVSTAFGARGYGLVNVSVGEVSPGYDIQMRAAPMMAFKVSRGIEAAPEIAGGESKFSLTINGTIQMMNARNDTSVSPGKN